MTANQIKAAEVFEKKRSNLVNESIGRDTLTETGRHNRVVEGETSRHNYATELNESKRTAEVARHNKAAESLGYADLSEQTRHNRQSETADYIKATASSVSAIGKLVDAFIPL